MDFIWGYRIHGSVLALNCGKPALFCPPDIKGVEMANVLNIPYNNELLTERNFEKLYDSLNYEKYNNNYKNIYKNYLNFLNLNGLKAYYKNTIIDQPKLFGRFGRGLDSTVEFIDIFSQLIK